jgi:hypothetical protein
MYTGAIIESIGSGTAPASYVYPNGPPDGWGDRPWPAFNVASPSDDPENLPSGYEFINGVPPPPASGDTTDPVVTITAPTASTTYSTSTTPLTSLAGTASDDVALASVTWSNSAGGSGTATGTTTWSVASITLQSGANVITVTATDSSSNTSTDTLTVTYTPPSAAVPTNYRKPRTLAGGGM